MAFFPEILRGDALCGKQSSCNRTAGNPSGFSPRSRNRGRPYKSAESEPRSVRFDSGQAPAHQTCHSTKRTHRRGCFCGVRLRRRHRHGAYQLHQKHHWCVSLCSACRKRLRRAVRLRSVRLGYRGRGAYICFCETNPPFFGLIFDAMDFARGIYGEILPNKSVGSFSKTNPPGEGKQGVFDENERIFVSLVGSFGRGNLPS